MDIHRESRYFCQKSALFTVNYLKKKLDVYGMSTSHTSGNMKKKNNMYI